MPENALRVNAQFGISINWLVDLLGSKIVSKIAINDTIDLAKSVDNRN